jgi:hypothetical protein
MFQKARPGEPAVLGDMADDDQGHARAFRRLDQDGGAGPALGHAAGLAFDPVLR